MLFWNNHKPPRGKIVMAFGTFDLLHAGHENFLRQARELGDYLIVVIARDYTVRSVKSRLPLNRESTRLKNLKKSGWADKVVLGNRDDKHKIILKHRPSILALGYDQFVFTQTLQKTLIDHSLDTEIVRLEAYFPQTYKSSLIRQNLEKAPATLPMGIKTTVQPN